MASNGKNILKIIVFVLVIVCILSLMLFTGRKDSGMITAYVKNGNISKKEKADCFFVRNEENVRCGYEGKLIPNVDEGTRVSAGQVIAYVVEEESEEDFLEMKKLERKIANAQKAVYAYTGKYPAEYEEADYGLRKLAEELSTAVKEGNISSYQEKENEINQLLKKKNLQNYSEEKESEYLEKLKAGLSEVQSRISGKSHEIKAPIAGTVTFYTDETQKGTTELFEKIEKMTAEDNYSGLEIGEIKKIRNKVSYAGQKVTADTFAAGISPRYYCYMVTENEMKINGTFYFEERSSGIKGSAQTVFSGKGITLLKCEKGVETLSKNNSKELDITVCSENGMKVPVSSLTDWDAPKINARLTVIKNGIVRYIYVEILSYDDEYAIIAPHSVFESTGYNVKINDTYVVNYESVREGQAI